MASVGGRTLPDHLQRRISKLHQKVEENVEGEVNQGPWQMHALPRIVDICTVRKIFKMLLSAYAC